jgi:hypothetical protein
VATLAGHQTGGRNDAARGSVWARSYVLGMEGLLAVVKAFAAGYGFTKLSATSTEFIERAQRKVHDALLVGGIFLKEDGPAEESESVPDAQFIDAAGGMQ